MAFRLSTTGSGLAVAVSVGRGVEVSVAVSVAGMAVNVSVEGMLVEVELAVEGGEADMVGWGIGVDGLQETVAASNRMKKYPDLIFISRLYPIKTPPGSRVPTHTST